MWVCIGFAESLWEWGHYHCSILYSNITTCTFVTSCCQRSLNIVSKFAAAFYMPPSWIFIGKPRTSNKIVFAAGCNRIWVKCGVHFEKHNAQLTLFNPCVGGLDGCCVQPVFSRASLSESRSHQAEVKLFRLSCTCTINLDIWNKLHGNKVWPSGDLS